jgi:hypothetical protein
MTTTEKTTRTRRSSKKDAPDAVTPDETTEPTTEPTEQADDTESATDDGKGNGGGKRRFNLSVNGIGMLGSFEDASEDEVPGTAASVDVSWLYPPMNDSYNTEAAAGFPGMAWKSFIVADYEAAERALRMAADRLGYGVKVRKQAVTVDTGEEYNDAGEMVKTTNDAWKVFFLAGLKKPSKKDGATTAAE